MLVVKAYACDWIKIGDEIALQVEYYTRKQTKVSIHAPKKLKIERIRGNRQKDGGENAQ